MKKVIKLISLCAFMSPAVVMANGWVSHVFHPGSGIPSYRTVVPGGAFVAHPGFAPIRPVEHPWLGHGWGWGGVGPVLGGEAGFYGSELVGEAAARAAAAYAWNWNTLEAVTCTASAPPLPGNLYGRQYSATVQWDRMAWIGGSAVPHIVEAQSQALMECQGNPANEGMCTVQSCTPIY